MATGGIFQLITNDGKQDRMLMASKLLKKRLYLIRRKRMNDPRIPYKDKTPTLLDIERTHILFTNAHFKPFAAMGYEYNIVKPNSGAVKLGSEVQFSIPQFGDFFNDMCFHAIVKPPQVTYTPQGGVLGDAMPSVRWCDYPGERLMKKTRFDVNGNPLDEYTSEEIVMHRQFRVPDHKRVGWKRNVGQQVATRGFIEDDLVGEVAGHQIYMDCCRGLQTPKSANGYDYNSKPNWLEVFVPLLFWCNLDPRLAVPSVAIPYGQRFIRIDLEESTKMFNWEARGNVDFAAADIVLTEGEVVKAELFINNLFVNPEVHEIYIKRIGFTLIRVHRKQVNNINKAEEEILLQNMKWPIEAMFIGLRPKININSDAETPANGSLRDDTNGAGLSAPITNYRANDLRDWHYFSKRDCQAYGMTGLVGIYSTVDSTGGSAVAPINVIAEPNIECCECHPLFDVLRVSAHGIPIYQDLPQQFYQSYIPYSFGGYNLNTPEDCGLVMINFCLYPGTYQPSGHVNVSRAREFYLRFTVNVDAANNGWNFSNANINDTNLDLIVVASALKFDANSRLRGRKAPMESWINMMQWYLLVLYMMRTISQGLYVNLAMTSALYNATLMKTVKGILCFEMQRCRDRRLPY